MDRIGKLKQEIKKYFTHPSHGLDHVVRVYKLAVKIAEKEGADMECVKAAALLHDIARKDELEGKKICHADKGAEMAKEILERFSYSKKQIKIITDAIKTHRYKKQLKPSSKVGEIIQDADRLDILGAIGIARIFTRGGERGVPIHNSKFFSKDYTSSPRTGLEHFSQKVLKITPDSFRTKTAQEIAKKRYAFTKEFVEKFLEEWGE